MEIEKYFNYLYKENIIFDNIEKEILSYAKKNSIPFLSIEKARFLEILLLIKKPEKIFEIGLGSGFSTYKILKNIPDSSTLISIDFNFFRVNDFFENVFKKLPENYKKKLTVYPLEAFYVIEKFVEIEEKFDFIFLDATKKDYYILLKNLIRLLKNNGILLVDNITYSEQTFKTIARRSSAYVKGIEQIKKFNNAILNNKLLTTALIPIGDGMSISVKGI